MPSEGRDGAAASDLVIAGRGTTGRISAREDDEGRAPALDDAALVTVTVRDVRGVPKSATIWACGTLDDVLVERRTDAEGRCNVPVSGAVALIALDDTGSLTKVELASESPKLEIVLPDPVGITGTIIDGGSEAPIAGATFEAVLSGWPTAVQARISALGFAQQRTEADDLGRFQISCLVPGVYRMECGAPGYTRFLDEGRRWNLTTDWDLGTIALEAIGNLRVCLLGEAEAGPPTVSYGRLAPRFAVDDEGCAVLEVPRANFVQHFSVWLTDGSMLNVYRDGSIEEVQEVRVHVGGRSRIRVRVEGEIANELASIGELALRIRFLSRLGYRCDWNRELWRGESHETDCIDADEVSLDLVALSDGWPNVLASQRVRLDPGVTTEATLLIPGAARKLAILDSTGAPLPEGVFVELRRAHDPTRWLASAYSDSQGAVTWPTILDAELYCSGVLDWGPPERFFIDLPLPNAAHGVHNMTLTLGTLETHRIRLTRAGQPVPDASFELLGRHSDQRWTTGTTDAEGWSAPFDLARGSAVDVRVHIGGGTQRVPLEGTVQTIELR